MCGANSFDYLTELQRHAQELVANPADWMPWNYRGPATEAADKCFALALSQLVAIDPDESTTEAIDDRHYWVAQGYLF